MRNVHTALPIATTHAIIVDVNGMPVVAFAGTDPVVLANWISDFDIRRTEGGAAEGFVTALDAVKADILERLPPDKPLAITGHSLGGALRHEDSTRGQK